MGIWMYKLGSFVIVILPAVLENAINECGLLSIITKDRYCTFAQWSVLALLLVKLGLGWISRYFFCNTAREVFHLHLWKEMLIDNGERILNTQK